VSLPRHTRHRSADRCTVHVRSHEGFEEFAASRGKLVNASDSTNGLGFGFASLPTPIRSPAEIMPQGTRAPSNPARLSPRELIFTCDICRKTFLTPHHINRHCTCLRRPPCTVDDAFGQCIRTKPLGRLPPARSARSGSTRTPCRSARAMCRWTLTRSMPFSASFPAALLRPKD
jgi:hypothetical protein